MATIRLAPDSFHEAACLRAELVNAPRVAHDDNVYFTQVQANVSKCYPRNSADNMEQLGGFGDMHTDWDHPGKMTVAGAFSHMPDRYHPGLFILYELGVFVRLDNGHHVCFSGLRYHGGFPPTAPEGEQPASWACRLLHVSYPSDAITNMSGRQAIGPLPGSGEGSKDDILYLSPEMAEHIVPNVKDYPLYSQRANYVSDSVGILSAEAHTTFVSRLLLRVSKQSTIDTNHTHESLKLCQHQMAAMPHNVHIDPEKFLSSFQYDGSDGSRKTVAPWRFGERIANLNEALKADYREAWQVVDQHDLNTRVFIPAKGQDTGSHTSDNTFDELQASRGEGEHALHSTYVISSNDICQMNSIY